jgi:hypothetical protein
MYYAHQSRHSATILWTLANLYYAELNEKEICDKLNISKVPEHRTPNETLLLSAVESFRISCRKNQVLKTLHLRAGQKTVTIVFSAGGIAHV